jgi:hypothetical protein
MIKVLSTTQPYTVCQECKAGSLPINDKITLDYFYSKEIKCPKCGSLIDWWNQILTQIRWPVANFSLAPAGAFSTWLLLTMKPGEVTTIKLDDFGIPHNARLLQVGYTAQGEGLIPLEQHGNVPRRHIIPHTIHLYGRPFGNPVPHTEVVMEILWIPSSEDEESWQNLVLAFEAFHNKSYESTIIPANVAVESLLHRVLSDALYSIASSKHVDNFLETAATYGHQLNVLLPFVVSTLSMPVLPEHIRGILNRLKKSRNQMAHQGKLVNVANEQEAAEYICASFFTFIYIKQVEQLIKATA